MKTRKLQNIKLTKQIGFLSLSAFAALFLVAAFITPLTLVFGIPDRHDSAAK
ncbi:MAG: hypothetical protein LC778_20080 [Acidobacteria bacterium]|nr:hypothetical protein [Acidobacteriota bacterium]